MFHWSPPTFGEAQPMVGGAQPIVGGGLEMVKNRHFSLPELHFARK
jgi:hypothetical protein